MVIISLIFDVSKASILIFVGFLMVQVWRLMNFWIFHKVIAANTMMMCQSWLSPSKVGSGGHLVEHTWSA
jgi:hypothetical protein